MDAAQIQGMLRNLVPLLATMEIAIDKAEDEELIASIPFSATNKNHVGSIYAGALFSIGEATGGVLLLRNHPGMLILVVEAKIAYLKKAESAVKARAKYPPEAKAQVLADLAANGKVRYTLPVEILNESGEVVSTVEINYYMRAQK